MLIFSSFASNSCFFTWLREVRFGCVYVGRDNFRFILIERVISVCVTSLLVLRSRFHLSVKTNNSRCIGGWYYCFLHFYGTFIAWGTCKFEFSCMLFDLPPSNHNGIKGVKFAIRWKRVLGSILQCLKCLFSCSLFEDTNFGIPSDQQAKFLPKKGHFWSSECKIEL